MILPTSSRTRTRGARGFTLVELLLATALVSMLMVALVDSLQGFATQITIVEQNELDLRYEESMAQMTRSVRLAWLVEEPADDTLAVTDAYGKTTTFRMEDGALRVERPNGAEGVLVDALDDFVVEPQYTQRLRPADEVDDAGTFYESSSSSGTASALRVEEDLPIALGFTLDSKAPEWANTVDGVQEIAVGATLESVTLPIAYALVITSDGSSGGGSTGGDGTSGDGTSGDGTDDGTVRGNGNGNGGNGGGNGNGSGFLGIAAASAPTDGSAATGGNGGGGGGRGNGGGGGGGGTDDGSGGTTEDVKLYVCHHPPGNPDNSHTIAVGSSAADKHLEHGDTIGVCLNPTVVDFDADLVIELYEARAPDDGRPYADPIASTSYSVSALPGASYAWVDASSLGAGYTVVCHVPPGSPSESYELAVPDADLDVHMGHGDILGACSGEEATGTTPVLVYGTPTSSVTLDLSVFASEIQPGRAYTLVVRVDGAGAVLLRGEPGSGLTGVATDDDANGTYSHAGMQVDRSVNGVMSYTQTEPYDVVQLVTLTLEPTNGDTLVRSAAVLGQTAVSNPWLGAVPGELPTLQSSDS